MYKSRIRSFGKCVMYAAILIAVLILTALVITKIAMCPLMMHFLWKEYFLSC